MQLAVLNMMQEKGYETIYITEREMHVLLSAYITAIIEPVIYEYDEKETEHCLMKVRIFYTRMDENNGIIKEPQGSFLIC